MKYSPIITAGRSLLLTIALATVAPRAHAVTLQQKWHEGDKLSYDLSLNGTLSLDTDANAPFLWAGLPIDVEVHGDGLLNLETQAVDDAGAGVVVARVPHLMLSGSGFEQKVVVKLEPDNSSVSFNGKPMKQDLSVAQKILIQPDYGLQIGANGRIQRFVPLKVKDDGGGATNDDAPVTTPGGLPLNVAGLLRSALLQTLPAPWPDGDVAVGDKWSVPARLPVPDAKAAGTKDGTMPPLQIIDLGSYNMTLVGQETIGGRQVWRVGVDGVLTIDKDKATVLNDDAAVWGDGSKFTSAIEKIKGDLWFDADAGELVKAVVVLRTQVKVVGMVHAAAAATGAAKATPTAATANAGPDAGAAGAVNGEFKATQSFDGTLKLTLSDVADAPGAN